jgi:hypothetical protein
MIPAYMDFVIWMYYWKVPFVASTLVDFALLALTPLAVLVAVKYLWKG